MLEGTLRHQCKNCNLSVGWMGSITSSGFESLGSEHSSSYASQGQPPPSCPQTHSSPSVLTGEKATYWQSMVCSPRLPGKPVQILRAT